MSVTVYRLWYSHILYAFSDFLDLSKTFNSVNYWNLF